MYDVLTIGSATRDVFLVSDEFQLIKSKKFFTGVGECVSLGSKIEAQQVHVTTGGGATNAAVTFANLGFNTATVSRVGTDRVGDAVLQELEDSGVETKLITRAKGQTGHSVLLTTSSGERSVLVYRGVSKTFSAKDLPARGAKAKWLYLTSLGGNMRVASSFIKRAAKQKTNIAWNPGGGELKHGLGAFKQLLPHLRVLNMNLEEAQKLTGTKSIDKMLRMLGEHGTIVIITDGSHGTHAFQEGKRFFAGTRRVPVVSRTGAGDAFGSGFVSGLIKTGDVKQALAIGTINAESVIGSLGAKRGLLTKWPSKKMIDSIPLK